MNMQVFFGVLIPFIGTSLGAFTVFFMKGDLKNTTQKCLEGFAAGVMVSASFFSLLLPSLEQSESMGKLSFLPAVAGFLLGMLFLLLLDTIIPHLHFNSDTPEGPKSKISRTAMLVLAVTLHNIPEGMAVGVVLASWLNDSSVISYTGALALAIGIAIQNFPEGAIISMPLKAQGATKSRSFLYGVLSGIVEPIGAVLTMLFASVVLPVLPYLLSFAAGAMMYVVVEELIPEISTEPHTNHGTVSFAAGFALMMLLDVALG